jgi:dimethylamine/trimethylamine dehydrogenase
VVANALVGKEVAGVKYLETLRDYYEEEVSGEAWFRALAERFEGNRRAKLLLLADVERHTVDIVRPLIHAYGIRTKSVGVLFEEGRVQARDAVQDWDWLLDDMRIKFPDYIVEFETLEAMAPAKDKAILKRMTDHEHAAIEFLEREAAGDPNSSAPLAVFLAAPAITSKAA